MDVASVCPLPVASLIWQPRPSTWVLTFVSKAMFALQPGESVLLPEQEAPNEEDDHWNDDPGRSVRAPSDLVPVKPRPEVMLVGHAFAPKGAPVRSLLVRLVVGEVDKAIEVLCDRAFTLEGVLQEGPRFVRMPLVYERAAGGPGTSNPVGVTREGRDAYGRRALPNLQPPGKHVGEVEDWVESVGFGPIAASWPSRAEKLGPRAAAFSPGTWSERPLPEGMDLGYFNQAPRDQQLAALRDTERLVLENLHPEHARLVTNLPGVRPAAFVERARGAPQRLALRADTLWIDTDQAIATLTWRGQLALERQDEVGRVLVGMESPGREVSWAELERATGRSRASSSGLHAVRLEHAAGGEDRTQDGATTATVAAELGSPVAAALPFAASNPGERRERSAPNLGAGLPFQRSAPQPPSQRQPPQELPQEPPPPVPVSPPMVSPPMVPPPMVPPPMVPPPMVVAARPAVNSPWAGGAPGSEGPARQSIGMAVAAMAAPEAALSADEALESGAVAVSNAAAGASAPWSVGKRELRAAPLEVEATESKPEPAREMLQLLWFDPESVARIRRVPRWKAVLEELERTPLDRELEDAGAKEPWEVEDRREVFEVLARGAPSDAREVEEALVGAMRGDGKLVAPLVLLAGEMELPFDELEALRAAATTAAALITAADEGLRAAVEAADKFLGRPGLAAAPSVSEGLTTRIREAFAREKKGLSGEYLDAQVERVLLVGRHYQKRAVFGGAFLRALVWLPGEKAAVMGYVPEELGKKLPMARRFRARVIGEVHMGQDQYEVQREAVRVVAVGRAGRL